MLIQATFSGADLSMGLQNGIEYSIRVIQNYKLYGDGLIVGVMTGKHYNYYDLEIPYSNIITFFKNWTNIKTNEK
jgi:hypothetical protein